MNLFNKLKEQDKNFKSEEIIKTSVIMKDKNGTSLLRVNSTKEKI